MKDIDIGKEYIIPSPGYRSVRERADSVQHDEQERSKFQHAKHQVGLFSSLFVLLSLLIELHAATLLPCQLCIGLLP